MRKNLLILLVVLTACQGADTRIGRVSSPADSASSGRVTPHFSTDCYEETIAFESSGKLGLPPLLPDGNYYGRMPYAHPSLSTLAELTACPGTENSYDVPIPPGFTPDWFCQIALTGSSTFGPGNLLGVIDSTTWLPKTKYFLYAYDANNNFIEAYQMGKVNKKKARMKFASPLQNGFTINSVVNFEIVHASQ
jgi:hypothetical protein